jgi:hypothetical protein
LRGRVTSGEPMLRRSFFTSVLALGLGLFAQATFAATISVGSYVPSTTTPFIVPIEITGAIDVNAFTFDLAFDPTSVMINTACDPFGDPFCDFVTGPVTQGTFFTDAAVFPPLFVPGFILLDASGDQTGQLIAVNGAWQDPGAGVSGDGILAFIEFVAVPGGDLDAPITVDGSVPSDEGSTVPEPSSLALAGIALVAMVGRRLVRRPGVASSPAAHAVPPQRTSRRGHRVLGRVLLSRAARITGLVAVLGAAPAMAQMAAGPYYATPSWDQTMATTSRFVVLTNFASEAVLDRETGLVWQKTPRPDPIDYSLAFQTCAYSPIGGRLGWRLPTVSELTSLFDPTVNVNPKLPAGHPFTVGGGSFWTTTQANTTFAASDKSYEVFGSFFDGPSGTAGFLHGSLGPTQTSKSWCVRGPGDAGTHD